MLPSHRHRLLFAAITIIAFASLILGAEAATLPIAEQDAEEEILSLADAAGTGVDADDPVTTPTGRLPSALEQIAPDVSLGPRVGSSNEDEAPDPIASHGVAPEESGPAAESERLRPVAIGPQEEGVVPVAAGIALLLLVHLLYLTAAKGPIALSILLPPSLLMSTRIDRDNVLDNEVRAQMLALVRDQPGLSIQGVREGATVAWGTAVHHLRVLESHRFVVSVRSGGHRRYFAANTEVARHRRSLAALVHPTAHRIARLVHERPGIDQTTLCQALDLQSPAASKHLSKFVSRDLVSSTREGRRQLYHPTDALQAALRLIDEGGGSAPAPSPEVRTHRPQDVHSVGVQPRAFRTSG